MKTDTPDRPPPVQVPSPVPGQALTDFDPIWYLQANEDVRAAGMDPWDHYRLVGHAEGRPGAPVQAFDLDHLLWRGQAETAQPALETLLAEGPPREQAVAGWVLARWYLEQDRPAEAWAAIRQFHAHPEGPRILRHPGPYLLGVQLALRAGDPEAAAEILARGQERFGPLTDFELAGIELIRARHGDDWEITGHLARLYVAQGLLPIQLDPLAEGCRLDRLTGFATALPPEDLGPADRLPLVSVIVPVFNGASGLGLALRGLRAQSWPALEILVVDDGSTDDSRAIAEAEAARDPRIRVLALERNQGAYPARNAGMAAARGAFLTVHDADDWSHPQKIEMQLRPLLAEPELQATVSHWVRAGDDLQMTRWRMEDRWIYRNVSSLMIRAGMRDILGYWDRVRVNADTEYYYRLITAYGAQSIREVCPGVPLAFGRTAPGSLTNRSATHLRTQFRGVRRDYMEAAHYWHAQAAGPDDLHMAERPATRPFRVPAEIGLGDPDPEPSEFDILGASPLFDADWYRLSFPDVMRSDVSPVRHYLDNGAREDRDPGPGFSTGAYRRAQDLPPEVVPLLHFERDGRAAGAAPLPGFPGALAGELSHQSPVLVFAHTSGKTLFGAERSLLGVVRRLAQGGAAPVVVLPALRNPAYLEALLEISAAVEVVPQIWRHLSRPPQAPTVELMRALIRRYQPVEVLVNTIALDAPLLAARQEGVPSVVYVRELPAEDQGLCRMLGGSAEALRSALLAEADRFLATSGPVASWLACPERTEIRPNSVDPDLFDMAFAPGRPLRVALISSNTAKKGVSDFLAVARIAEAAGRGIRFLLIGPPTPDLHLMRPWPANVEFRGYAQTPAEALAQTDLVLSLSKFAESFGRTVLEGMAAGRPVICYDRGAPPTLVESGVSGFVVPADDREGVANAVLALDAARGQLQRMSDAARRRARILQARAYGAPPA
ncbi:glycosyltransferase [Maritimibacter alkaliphilus]|uniref:glycosyltransferase n=1 Tax=Maritimibacter alkaliphilus TaxID=404236 RepID=UPI001C939AC4|nr:glycosyltransferase [Maritimibacter alkaliphilus]MBY6092914.1 glycosyltransferase [Maritimibacter alkaliphilus]